MDKEDIRKLEPKFTGNQRHLTEGEAAAIVHDPNSDVDDDDGGIPLAAALAPNGRTINAGH